jgi:hypothetical protein
LNALLFVSNGNLEPIDDFVLSHLGTFDEKKLLSADRADLRLPENTDKEEAKEQLADARCRVGFALQMDKGSAGRQGAGGQVVEPPC